MPELPEVEFARRSLEHWFEGRRLIRTEAQPGARTFRGCDLGLFHALEGALVSVRRRGKYLMVQFSNQQGFVAHLGMTGKFLKRPEGEEVKWSRARFFLDSGDVIHFQDMRLFGRIEAVPGSALSTRPEVQKLGVDPLADGLTMEQLCSALECSKQPLKVALMDQHRLAGLGNIHAAEALYRARLHPERAPASLSTPEWRALTKGVKATIDYALRRQDGSEEIDYVEEPGAPNPFLIYGRAGTPCRRCRNLIQSFTQAGRTTYFCPICQPKESSRDAEPKRKRPRSRRHRG